MKISIETEINAGINAVWRAWITPADITQWNFASDEWCCPSAAINLTVGGSFNYRMEAKDGSMGFDFEGEFTEVITKTSITYRLDDDRRVMVAFFETSSGVKVVETFDTEDVHSAELQKQGWQSILNNFKAHVEKITVDTLS